MHLRYCATGGSSRGVREFVEQSLIPFAKRNPQIEIRTEIKSGHPCIYGDYSKYLSGMLVRFYTCWRSTTD